MAQAREVVPVMDQKVTPKSRGGKTGTKAANAGRKGLGGPYGASFTRRGDPRPHLRAPLDPPGRPPLRRDRLGVTATPASPARPARPSSSRRTSRSRAFWSQLATNVVVSKYFRGHLGTPERENSVRQLIDRVVNTIAAWARDPALLRDGRGPRDVQGRADPPARPPEDELQLAGLVQRRHRGAAAVLRLLHQLASRTRCPASWTSPRPRRCCSSSAPAPAATCPPSARPREKMAGGGTASGPVSFMKGYDAFAGVVKSGGKTRRAAKMVILDAGHPDVLDFIDSKAHEEQKAWALIEAGYDPSFTGEAYGIRLLPERQPQRPRDGRVHAGRRGRRGLDDPRGRRRRADGHVQGPRHLPQDGGRRPPLRRPGHPVRHHHQRLAHELEHGPDLRVQPVLASTCSSTTRPATSPA